MVLDFLNLSLIARAAIQIMSTTKMVSIMATIQSNLSANQSNPSPIELADRAQRRVFVVSIVFGVAAALIAALLAWLVWRANNAYQAAVIADANARSEEAKKGASEADAKAAQANLEAARANEGLAKSNEEIARLTVEAETAKTERAEADKQIAIAKANAARADEGAAKATAEVARLQIIVANAETKRAEAEKALLELQERIKPRHLSAQQNARFLELLNANPKGSVEVRCPIGDPEIYNFALEIEAVLKAAGWQTTLNNRVIITPMPVGLKMWVRSGQTAPAHAIALLNILDLIGLTPVAEQNPELPEGQTVLIVGAKP
jgi:hypothetical protein